MARAFTEQEKQNIRSKLLAECRKSWAKYGYKKTSIDELCAQVGISKGAFYLFLNRRKNFLLKLYAWYRITCIGV